MTDYDRRYSAALAELHAAGITRSAAEPLFTRALRRLGLRPRPPQYHTFWQSALGLGAYFTASWGLIMYVFFWRSSTMPLWLMLASALIAGALFGAIMAAIYLRSRKKHRLTPWTSL